MSAPAIFVSYRRGDAPDAVERVVDRLLDAFGTSNVFRDQDSIDPGQDFASRLILAVRSARVVLVMIGPNWAASTDAAGAQRLALSQDWVRTEIEAARLFNVPLFPILVAGAGMPAATDLPPSLAWFSRLNARQIGRDPHFRVDMERLIDHLARELKIERASASNATELWKRLAHSEAPHDLRNFIATFDATHEAFKARSRLEQVERILRMRDATDKIERFGPCEGEEFIKFLYETLEELDAFLDRFAETEWGDELTRMRKILVEAALEVDGYEAENGELYCYGLYQRDRSNDGKPHRD